MALTDNQLRFVREYVACRIATQAYMRAFTTPDFTPAYNTARTEGSRLLANPDIKAEIEAASEVHKKECGFSTNKVLREYALCAFVDKVEYFEPDPHTGLPRPRHWDKISPAMRRVIQSIKVKKRIVRKPDEENPFIEEIEEIEYRFADKLKALDKLADHLGLTKDNDAVKQLLALLATTAAGDQSSDATQSGQSADGANGAGAGGPHTDGTEQVPE